jgi:hypothetical protein
MKVLYTSGHTGDALMNNMNSKANSHSSRNFLHELANPGGPFPEIVRQQWNFSAPASTREIDEYRVELSKVTVLELTIVPNINGGVARARPRAFAYLEKRSFRSADVR